jgi:hypothetical protein
LTTAAIGWSRVPGRAAAGAGGCGEDDGGESGEASCEPGDAEGADEEWAAGVAEFSADFGGADGLSHPPGWRDFCEGGEAEGCGDANAGTYEDGGAHEGGGSVGDCVEGEAGGGDDEAPVGGLGGESTGVEGSAGGRLGERGAGGE